MAEVGRPTIMTEMTLKKLEEAFSNGASDKEACFLAGISHQTLYDYQERCPEYVERKQALKDMVKYQAKLNIKNKIFDGDIDTSKWYAERKIKEEFSVKNETELSGKGGGPVEQSLTIKFIDGKHTDTKGV